MTEPDGHPEAPERGAAAHRRRLDRALLELAGADDDPQRPPPRSVLHGLARVGLRLRPLPYYGLLGSIAFCTAVLVPLVWALLWTLVWRHDEVRTMPTITSSLQIGLALGAVAGTLSWLVARLRRLSRWHEL